MALLKGTFHLLYVSVISNPYQFHSKERKKPLFDTKFESLAGQF